MSDRALFSLVVPVYGVEAYLSEFLSSLEQQTYPLANLDIVFVDDGSPDRCGEILDAWASGHSDCARVVHKSNGGLCSARNAGLELVRNLWVTFCDPDDVLPPDYFERIESFLAQFADARPAMLVSRIIRLDDATGETSDTHPLKARFRDGDKLVDMDRFPDFIHLQAASGFYRVDDIRRLGLQFESRVRPVFEDAHFTLRYLAEQDERIVGVVASAHYWYRRRQSRSSLVDVSWKRDERYLVLPREGYLDVLQRLNERLGVVPLWAQNTVLYDLLFYYLNDAKMQSPVKALDPATATAFHDTVARVMGYIDTETIRAYSIKRIPWSLKHALIAAYKGEELRPPFVHVRSVDSEQRLVQITYRFGGEPPSELFLLKGRPVSPVHMKTRQVVFLGKPMAFERIVWLPLGGTLRVFLDGVSVPLSDRWYSYESYAFRPADFHRVAGKGSAKSPDSRRRVGAAFIASAQRHSARVLRWLASTHMMRRRLGAAWVLMDRDSRAGDNAEHLYDYLAEMHPEKNTYFVLRKDSPDWPRLRKRGFRLVAYGTWLWKLLLLNAEHLISSQVDNYVCKPLDWRLWGRPAWRFTFLQHGVIKDDLSRWLNNKSIDLLVTSTQAEYLSIVGSHTPYTLTSKEVRLTGLPRWDRLLKKASAHSLKDAVVVMPTWRRSLLGDQIEGGNDRHAVAGFTSTPYARNWRDLLGCPMLREAIKKADMKLIFMPHPNMKPYLDQIGVFDGEVRLCSYETSDVQDILARASVVVTDYSSIAFDAAYIDCPVVYFQFDQDDFFGGDHLFKPGYFDYEADGFGPVCADAETAATAVVEILGGTAPASELYSRRRRLTFGLRDARACERTYQAINELTRPYSRRVRWLHEAEALVAPGNEGTSSLTPGCSVVAGEVGCP